MNPSKEIISILASAVTVIATIVGSTVTIMSKMATKVELKELETKVMGRLDSIDADLRQFYHLTGKLEGEIEGLKARVK